jgi:hypothetical protein
MSSNNVNLKKMVECNPKYYGQDTKGYRIPYGFSGYKPPPRKPVLDEESEQAQRLFALCDTPMEKEIAKLLFCDGLKAETVAYAVGYCERQIYRIKKKLRERVQNNEQS